MRSRLIFMIDFIQVNGHKYLKHVRQHNNMKMSSRL
jgi:hypothetical protein